MSFGLFIPWQLLAHLFEEVAKALNNSFGARLIGKFGMSPNVFLNLILFEGYPRFLREFLCSLDTVIPRPDNNSPATCSNLEFQAHNVPVPQVRGAPDTVRKLVPLAFF